MADTGNNFKKKIRNFTFKALKATVKGILFYAIYFVFMDVFGSNFGYGSRFPADD